MALQEHYHVGRGELLGWINNTLDLRLNKVEETSNGAIACQLMDALYPGVVPIKKVDFNARSEYDAINNYKVLQDVFNKLGVDKDIDVPRLVKGRPLDNTEFMQWLKGYWDNATGGAPVEGYDALARRALGKTGGVRGAANGGGGGAAAGRLNSGPVAPGALLSRRTAAAAGGGAAGGALQTASYASLPKTSPRSPGTGTTAGRVASGKRLIAASANAAALSTRASGGNPNAAAAATATTISAAPSLAASASAVSVPDALAEAALAERLQDEAAAWRAAAEAAAKEKDFYYSKLRALELLCTTRGLAGQPFARAVEDVLYAPTQEAGEACLAAAVAEVEATGALPADGPAAVVARAQSGGSGSGAVALEGAAGAAAGGAAASEAAAAAAVPSPSSAPPSREASAAALLHAEAPPATVLSGVCEGPHEGIDTGEAAADLVAPSVQQQQQQQQADAQQQHQQQLPLPVM